ncbi:unnamed protein product [Dicrocoelium dendriticum]|nr:unnamed protein product [Dicrocoelium dendriticum]
MFIQKQRLETVLMELSEAPSSYAICSMERGGKRKMFVSIMPFLFPAIPCVSRSARPVNKSRPSTFYSVHLEYSPPPPRLELEDNSLTSDAENMDPNMNTPLAISPITPLQTSSVVILKDYTDYSIKGVCRHLTREYVRMRENMHRMDLKLDYILRQMASDGWSHIITLNSRLESYDGMQKMVLRDFISNLSLMAYFERLGCKFLCDGAQHAAVFNDKFLGTPSELA